MRKLSLALAAAVIALWAAASFADLIVHVRNAKGEIVASMAVPPGGYTETIERPATGPTPTPNPNPNPNPSPPSVTGPAKFISLIRDDAPGRMTSGQLAALADPNVRAQITAAKLLFSEFDVNSAAVQQPPPQGLNLKQRMVEAGVSAPCLILFDAQGRVVRGVPLPNDPAGVTTFIQGR